jgi:hypothetical protein
MDPAVKRALTRIPETAWKTIEYTDAVFAEATNTWISKAKVSETVFTAFTFRKKGRADHRPAGRTPHPGTEPESHRRRTLLVPDPRAPRVLHHRERVVLDTVTADKTHRKHAIIVQVNADLQDSALSHMPSGVFAANSTWLVAAVMAYDLTLAAGDLAAGPFGEARTGTIRREPIHVPARIATSARRIRLHLPEERPWKPAWEELLTSVHAPPQAA